MIEVKDASIIQVQIPPDVPLEHRIRIQTLFDAFFKECKAVDEKIYLEVF